VVQIRDHIRRIIEDAVVIEVIDDRDGKRRIDILPAVAALAFAPVSPNSSEEDWLARQTKPRLPEFEYRRSRSKPGSRS
jgi:hypothetical protein